MKRPFASDEKLIEIAEKYGTPLYLYDSVGIMSTAERVKKAFSFCKGHRQYFAVKATPTAAILKLLRECGIYVECSSIAELRLAERCGFKGEEILFAPNYPLEEDIYTAAELGAAVNLDGIELIEPFARVFNKSAAGAPCGAVGMRFNPGGEFVLDGETISKPSEQKFGFTKKGLFEGAEKLKELGVKSFGLHGYMGGNIQSEKYYETLARLLMTTAVEVAKRSGLELHFINLSGGVGVGYLPGEPTPDIEKMGLSVELAFNEILLPAGFGAAAIYTELGRYMTAPHGLLLSRVIHKKEIYKSYISLDASAANLMRPMLYGAYHHMTVVGKQDLPADEIYDVVGSVCENTDKLAIDRNLPEVEIGDLIAIHDVGAHGHSMGYNYGGKLRSGEVLLEPDGSTRMIRRAETVDDWLATQIIIE